MNPGNQGVCGIKDLAPVSTFCSGNKGVIHAIKANLVTEVAKIPGHLLYTKFNYGFTVNTEHLSNHYQLSCEQ